MPGSEYGIVAGNPIAPLKIDIACQELWSSALPYQHELWFKITHGDGLGSFLTFGPISYQYGLIHVCAAIVRALIDCPHHQRI